MISGNIFNSKLITALEKYEGRRDYFYRDSVGQVTIGIGFLMRTEGDVAGLRMLRRSDRRSASSQEILAAFRAVKAEPYKHQNVKDHKMHIWGASHYKTLSGAGDVFMEDTEIDRIRGVHINEFHRYLQHSFSRAHGYKQDFDSLPDPVRLALFDMMFNLGPTKFPAQWPTMISALKAENWKAAAIASRRPQLSGDRNGYVHDLLMSA